MENAIKGMTTCKICGRDFPLIAEEHYISKEASKMGLAAIAGGTSPLLWDSFDCPHCGCQNRLHLRYRLTDNLGQDYPLDYDEDKEDEESCCCCCGSDACDLNRGEQE